MNPSKGIWKDGFGQSRPLGRKIFPKIYKKMTASNEKRMDAE